ncbi:arginase family protein [Agromyces sp. G08B096]|uniref:Arginase family protein n=1 Tax=Agromyces sp. G08B096 TaxID=3156399 RepID=A0AAU7W8W7_9MICO
MKITVLGVPSSSGAYCVGVERAPGVLRDAGLVTALAAGGDDVVDAGDLTTRLWSPDRERPFVQNLDEEVEALDELAGAAAPLLADGDRLLVLGGSCTAALGLCAAVARSGRRPRLVYVDRHFDLNTPASTTDGSLSWMGMAHALGLPGAAHELVAAAGGPGLLAPEDLVYLGVDPTGGTDWERAQVQALGIRVVPQSELSGQPAAAAAAALDALSPGAFVVHLDVDVLDFLDAPIAENLNGRNSGPSLAQLEPALRTLWRHPDCLGMSIGQLDPAHARADETAIPRLVDVLRAAVSAHGAE